MCGKFLYTSVLRLITVTIGYLLLLSLCGCSIIKKRFNKTNKITKIETLTVTNITESLDTNLIFGADSANFNTNLNDLFDGFTGEDNGIEVNVFVDKATGKTSIKTKTKPKTVPVKFNRTTTIKSKNNSYVKEKTKVKTKDKTPIELPWFKIIFAGTLSLLLLLILISRKARDKLSCMLPFIGQGKKFD